MASNFSAARRCAAKSAENPPAVSRMRRSRPGTPDGFAPGSARTPLSALSQNSGAQHSRSAPLFISPLRVPGWAALAGCSHGRERAAECTRARRAGRSGRIRGSAKVSGRRSHRSQLSGRGSLPDLGSGRRSTSAPGSVRRRRPRPGHNTTKSIDLRRDAPQRTHPLGGWNENPRNKTTNDLWCERAPAHLC